MISEYREGDIENFLKIVSEISEEIHRKRLLHRYHDLSQIDEICLKQIRKETEVFIRTSLEKIDSLNAGYYMPLLYINKNLENKSDKIKIFTLNYDGLIEILCESHNIRYSDGFDLNWEPSNFDKADVQLFKLHGSLF